MVTLMLRVLRGILLTLSGLAAVLIVFALMQFNLHGAGWMAMLALASFVTANILRRVLGVGTAV